MPDMQQKDWAVDVHMQLLLSLPPLVLTLLVVIHNEPVAVLPGIAPELQLAQAATAAWPVLAVVPTVLVLVVLPRCCTPVRTVDEQQLVAAKNKLKRKL
jgi:hypothetical protein